MSIVSRAFVFFGKLGQRLSICSLILWINVSSASCGADSSAHQPDANPGKADDLDARSGGTAQWQQVADLPTALSNNAVAAIDDGTRCTVFSFMGIGGALTSADIVSSAYRWNEGDPEWETLTPTPGPPRVAASAVAVNGNVYVVGGYAVAANGSETSSERLDMFDTALGAWRAKAAIPRPIDDAVVVSWRNQYIVIVSGWSNTTNVADVQIYDAINDNWMMGTPFPGTAAFGHAGGIDGDTLLIVDGAASTMGFPIVGQAWRGDLALANLPTDPPTLTWTSLGAHPGKNRYRAAGGGPSGEIWIHGGTSTPYNFNGIRYDNGEPATPLGDTLIYKAAEDSFELSSVIKPVPTMDHRSLARCGDRIYSVGGLIASPTATANVWRIDSNQ